MSDPIEELKKRSFAYRRTPPPKPVDDPEGGDTLIGGYWVHRNHDPSMRYGGDWTVMFWAEPKDDHQPVAIGRYPTHAKAEQAIWDHWAALTEEAGHK